MINFEISLSIHSQKTNYQQEFSESFVISRTILSSNRCEFDTHSDRFRCSELAFFCVKKTEKRDGFELVGVSPSLVMFLKDILRTLEQPERF